MKLSSKVAELTQIIEPAVTACDVSLWGIEFVPQGRRSLLRIYIETLPEQKAEGKQISIDDCAAVTHQVGGVLDVHDPIAGEYMLEVSSPGLDRAFFSAHQLHDFIGSTISLRLIHPISENTTDSMEKKPEKRRKLTGKLISMDDNNLVVEADKQNFSIALDNIDKANLVYQF